jgi:RES domain-containing protein
VISLYRISSAEYPVNSGTGAALYGGRWNRIGTPVIYAAQSASLAALEVLVHYSILPSNHVLTQVEVPEPLVILRIEESQLPIGWDAISYATETQDLGEQWVRERDSVILSVPSSIIPGERNFLINPAHAAFSELRFQPPRPFRFDPRLRK